MAWPDPSRWTVRRIAQAVNAGDIRVADVLEACFEAVEREEPRIGAFAWLDREPVLAEANAGAAGEMLAGVPIGIKDVIDTADIPTQYGSTVYAGHIPSADAFVVSAARQAGAVILGKTTTTEFAMTAPTATRNPRNPHHTPGGSSSGSAAAVAAGMVPAALGTQTAGSTIRPASFCGVVGYKPSFGWADRTGIKALAQGLDTVGMFARTVDCVALLAACLCRRPALADAGPCAGKLGVLSFDLLDQAEAATREVIEQTARSCERAGARVVARKAPSWFDALPAIHDVFLGFEVPGALAHELWRHGDDLRRETRDFIAARSFATSVLYEDAVASALRARRKCDALFADCDVLLVPAAPGEAPRGLQSTGSAVFNAAWTLLHLPCLTLPAGTGPNGLPIGIQLVGRYGMDAQLLSISAFVEHALNGSGQAATG